MIKLEQYLKESSCRGHHCEFDFLDMSCEECKQKILEEHNKKVKAGAIDDVERELLRNGFIATHHALEVWHEIAEQLKEQSK